MSENGQPEEPSRLVCTIILHPDKTVSCDIEGHHIPVSSKHLGRMFAMAHENLGEVLGRLLGGGGSVDGHFVANATVGSADG